MDTNNWRSTPPSGEPTMDTGDWRTQLQPDSRQRIVNKIMDTLKRHLPFSGQEGLNELRKIAVRFEEKIFTAATSQTDYLRKISLKMLTMENKNTIPSTGNNSKPPDPGSQGMQNQVHSQGQTIPISLQSNQAQAQLLPQSVPNNMASAGVQSSAGLQSGMPTVSGLTQNTVPNVVGQNSNMQNMSGISQNSLGQGMSSNIFANQQRQMQGRQQVLPQQLQQQQQQQQQQHQQQNLYHQQLQNQVMKQKSQQGNLQPSLMQSHMQQQQNLLPPTQLQSSQQSGMQTSSVIQQSSMQATPLPGLQHNPQSSLQQSTQSMLQQHQQFRQQQQAQQAASAGIHQETKMAQQSMMPQQQQQPPQSQHQQPHMMRQQTNAANTQQNQMIGQQNSISDMQQQRLLGQANNLANLQQQQLMAQKNMSSIHQQQLGPQNNSSGLQQQQPQLIGGGAQSGNSSMQTNQQSLHMLPQPKVPLQQTQQSAPNLLPTQVQTSQQTQQQPQLMSQMQSQSTLQQQLGLQQQANQLQQNMQQRLQSQNFTDQQKQLYQSQRAVPETSSTSLDSTAQTGLANGGDWQEEVYQKIQTLKETYLPELNEMYQKIATKLPQHDSNPQQPKSEQIDKLKLFKTMLERLIGFLSVSKASISPTVKEKLCSYEKQIVNFINSSRPRKPVSMMQQGQLPPPHMHSMQQPQPQINQAQSHDNQMNPQLQSINLQGSVPTLQPNNMTNIQHNSSSPGVSTAQQTQLNSLQPGSSLDSGQGNALGSIQQVAPGPLQQNPMSTSQQANFNSLSSQSGLNVLSQNINPLQSNSNMLQHQHQHHMKQQQEQQMLQSQKYKQQFQQRQLQQQYMQQKQQLYQQQQQQQRQQQPQQQAKQQLSTQSQTHQMPQLHQMNDVNDMRQGMGVKQGVLLPASQRPSYTHQQLKSGANFPVSSPQLLQAASPQMPQHSSPQVDQQSLLTSISKTGTPLQSANSPFVVPSPSTSLASSPMPGESEKPVLGTSLPNVANFGNQQGTGVQAGSQSLAIGTPGISASPLLAEFTGVDGTHANALTAVSSKSNITEEPLERLMKAVKSISRTALGASVSDISSVVSMTDRIAGSAPGNGSRAAVGEDLVAMTKCRLQARNFVSQDGMSGTKKIRRYTSAMPLNVVSSAGSLNDSFKQLTGSETSDLESTATSSVKRPSLEANHALLEEIREINQRLIDTVVDISDEDVDPGAAAATAEGGEGTIVKCSFSAVALSSNLKSHMSAQMSPIQPLYLLVPTNYPTCSPILLDKFPVDVSKDYEDLSVKAKSRFSISLRSLSQPMSLGEIARTWDVCARAVISDHAKLSGGGSFSSKYGTWENCLSAA